MVEGLGFESSKNILYITDTPWIGESIQGRNENAYQPKESISTRHLDESNSKDLNDYLRQQIAKIRMVVL